MLHNTLESVASSVINKSCEVFIVDNGSTDETAELCRGLFLKHPRIDWHYIYDAMPGLLTGRHRGAQEASGDVLCFLDDDVILSSSWWDGVQDSFSDQKIVLAGGPSVPEFAVNPPNWLSELWDESEGGGRLCPYLSLIVQGSNVKLCRANMVFGLNFAIRKSTWIDCGGFHPDCIPRSLQRYQGDGETGLSMKIEAAQLLTLYHPALQVTHLVPEKRLTIEAFLRRTFYQGVCDSYTKIRIEGCVSESRKESLHNGLLSFNQRFNKSVRTMLKIYPLQKNLADEYKRGFCWHQNEVLKDEILLKWVCQPNYFDYKLPEGWEGYLNRKNSRTRDW